MNPMNKPTLTAVAAIFVVICVVAFALHNDSASVARFETGLVSVIFGSDRPVFWAVAAKSK